MPGKRKVQLKRIAKRELNLHSSRSSAVSAARSVANRTLERVKRADSNYPIGFSIAYHKLRRAASFCVGRFVGRFIGRSWARRTIVYRLAEDIEIGLWSVPGRIIPFECIECFEDKRLFLSSIDAISLAPSSRRLTYLVNPVRVEGDVILDLRHRFKWGLISPYRVA